MNKTEGGKAVIPSKHNIHNQPVLLSVVIIFVIFFIFFVPYIFNMLPDVRKKDALIKEWPIKWIIAANIPKNIQRNEQPISICGINKGNG